MACSNCFNGCVETTSDKCIKYTGVDVPVLGIKNGDSLSYVEQALVTFLTSTLDGSGIKLTIPSEDICSLVAGYLPTCADLTLLDLSIALIKSACDLQTQVDDINETLTALDADYTIGCLSGVTSSSNTHEIIQAIITKVCSVDSDVTALALDVSTNYVAIVDINTYIAAYLDATSTTTLISSKMIPWVAVEYYGPINDFDITGKGSGNWDKIYLCNGSNGTPDKRGRVGIGATTGMGGGALNVAVDPTNPNNPAYSLLTTGGANVVTLGITQIPSHTHTATAVVVDPSHTHTLLMAEYPTGLTASPGYDGGDNNYLQNSTRTTSASVTGISVNVTNASTGGGQPHSNVQPVLACYYIIFIP
jgi:microcystin-dependent protein